MPKPIPFRPVAVAACVFALTAGREVQLLPAGVFRASDGRPVDAPGWRIDADIAARIIADVASRNNALVLDYEHQTLLAADNGQPAPAAGWFKMLEWREGDGLYATDVEWTARATAMIESGEYKYISPVFSYDKKTGVVLRLLNAALTNNPALDGMDAVAARFSTPASTPQELLTMDMDDLLDSLRWLLNLPALATADEVAAELQKAVDMIKQDGAAAMSVGLGGFVASQREQLAALTASAAAGATALQSAQDEIAALTAASHALAVSSTVSTALASGQLLPAQKDWALALGQTDMAALTGYLATTQPIAALNGLQSGGVAPGAQVDASDASAIAAAAKVWMASEVSAGRDTTIAAAVAHVMAGGA
jgi:phage I-like protein